MKFLESGQPGDYETDIDALASEGYNVIITIGSSMGDASASKAKQYTDIKFAIVDNTYAISGLANVTSLIFAEEQAGFLAGGMSKIGKGCDVLFGVGGDAVNVVLLAAWENNLPAIGADVDEYNIYLEIQSALIQHQMIATNCHIELFHSRSYQRLTSYGHEEGFAYTCQKQRIRTFLASFQLVGAANPCL